MYADSFYPTAEVDKVKAVLLNLCRQIEQTKPADLPQLYALTHASTIRINHLQEDFAAADSEIETVARDTIGTDFEFIAKAYGFDADTEELIAPRDW